jgi:limonene 1,2-monooxygenase
MISAEALRQQWATYRRGAEVADRRATPLDWRVALNVFVAETSAEAHALARTNSLGRCIQYILDLTRRSPAFSQWKRNAAQRDDECDLDYFLDEVLIVGDPDEVARKLVELRKGTGEFGTLVLVAHDWDDRERWVRCLELFVREVVPQLNP